MTKTLKLNKQQRWEDTGHYKRKVTNRLKRLNDWESAWKGKKKIPDGRKESIKEMQRQDFENKYKTFNEYKKSKKSFKTLKKRLNTNMNKLLEEYPKKKYEVGDDIPLTSPDTAVLPYVLEKIAALKNKKLKKKVLLSFLKGHELENINKANWNQLSLSSSVNKRYIKGLRTRQNQLFFCIGCVKRFFFSCLGSAVRVTKKSRRF